MLLFIVATYSALTLLPRIFTWDTYGDAGQTAHQLRTSLAYQKRPTFTFEVLRMVSFRLAAVRELLNCAVVIEICLGEACVLANISGTTANLYLCKLDVTTPNEHISL